MQARHTVVATLVADHFEELVHEFLLRDLGMVDLKLGGEKPSREIVNDCGHRAVVFVLDQPGDDAKSGQSTALTR